MSLKFYNHDDGEMFEDYAAEFDPEYREERRRRKKHDPHHVPKKTESEIIDELADDTGIVSGFETTYQPSKHERGWLLQSLQNFYYQDLITDVMAVVKGGKEASVYRCEAHDSTDATWLAAKVYRPRMFRQLRNDRMYRQGRAVLGMDGKSLNEKDWRARKAMNKGGDFGKALEHTSWLMHEYRTLNDLYEAGAAVPKPYAASENALLMSYHGDDNLPAPTLSEVHIQPEEVVPLFEQAMTNINLMLQHNIVHGDLSAFNILYDMGKLVIIDFPQVVDIENNPDARKILKRDILRVCECFIAHGMSIDPDKIGDQLWDAYGTPDVDPDVLLFDILEAVSFDDYEAADE